MRFIDDLLILEIWSLRKYHHTSPESGNETRFINHNQTHLMWPIMTTSNQPLMETPKLRQSVNARIEQARTDHTSMPDLSPQGHSKLCADEAVHHYKDNRPPPLLFEDPDVGFRPISIRKSETYVQVDTVSFFCSSVMI